jgi:hypothetical protein
LSGLTAMHRMSVFLAPKVQHTVTSVHMTTTAWNGDHIKYTTW